MRHRLVAIAGACTLALASAGSVSADTYFPPTGSYLSTVSETICSDGLCTYVQVNVDDTVEGFGVCLIVNHITEEFNTTYEIESGCAAVDGLGTPIYTDGFLTGFTDTTVQLRSDLTGQDRQAVASSENTIVSRAMRSAERDSLVSGGCRYSYTSRNIQVTVAGTVTLEGYTFTDEGGSLNREATLRTRC